MTTAFRVISWSRSRRVRCGTSVTVPGGCASSRTSARCGPAATAGWRRLGIGAVLEQGGGDGADRQGGHDQDGVPGDRGVEPDLGLVQPEVVLAELEVLLDGPPEPGGADQQAQAHGRALGDEAVVVRELAGPQVAADQQVMARGGGAGP